MSSRYDAGKKVWVDSPSRGRVQAVHLQPAIWSNYPYSQHQVTVIDRMDLLAYDTYGDGRRYWFIAEMNTSLTCPDDLVTGTAIFIPQSLV